MALPTPSFQIFGLLNHERINFCHFKSTSLWYVVVAALGNSHSGPKFKKLMKLIWPSWFSNPLEKSSLLIFVSFSSLPDYSFFSRIWFWLLCMHLPVESQSVTAKRKAPNWSSPVLISLTQPFQLLCGMMLPGYHPSMVHTELTLLTYS